MPSLELSLFICGVKSAVQISIHYAPRSTVVFVVVRFVAVAIENDQMSRLVECTFDCRLMTLVSGQPHNPFMCLWILVSLAQQAFIIFVNQSVSRNKFELWDSFSEPMNNAIKIAAKIARHD